jgi:ABC-type branched-subunit amino acid transport system substrate-binding protein
MRSGDGGGGSDSASGTTEGPIVIGTANSLTGVLAPFELAINDGMDVAAADINAAGGVDGRQIEIVHVDSKSDLNLAATTALEVIEKGADVVVPMCDADYGAPGARAANEKGILAITCAGAPGIGKQVIEPLTFNTYTGSPTESAAGAEYAYRTKGFAPRVLPLRPRPGVHEGRLRVVQDPLDARAAVNAFFRHFEEMTGKAAVVGSYPLLGYSLVQTIAKGVEIAGTTDGKALGKALETVDDEPLLAGPTTYTENCHVPVQRPLLITRYEDGKPRSTGEFVRPEKVPDYPC